MCVSVCVSGVSCVGGGDPQAEPNGGAAHRTASGHGGHRSGGSGRGYHSP